MYTTLKLLKSDLKNLRNAGSKFTNILEVGVRKTSSSYTSTPVSLIYLYTVCTSQYTIHMYPYIYIFIHCLGVFILEILCPARLTFTIVFMIIVFVKYFIGNQDKI